MRQKLQGGSYLAVLVVRKYALSSGEKEDFQCFPEQAKESSFVARFQYLPIRRHAGYDSDQVKTPF